MNHLDILIERFARHGQWYPGVYQHQSYDSLCDANGQPTTRMAVCLITDIWVWRICSSSCTGIDRVLTELTANHSLGGTAHDRDDCSCDGVSLSPGLERGQQLGWSLWLRPDWETCLTQCWWMGCSCGDVRPVLFLHCRLNAWQNWLFLSLWLSRFLGRISNKNRQPIGPTLYNSLT